MEGEEMIHSRIIDRLLTEEFFSQYSLNNIHFSLKDRFFDELIEQYDYRNNEVDKDDLLYLIQRLSEEQY